MLIAFHGQQSIKDKYLIRVKEHKAADDIIKGTYWQNGKGCAVGCTIHSDQHSAYETELGIPQILATLEDGIFENLPNERAKEWPEQFLDAIPVGADLSNVWPQYAVWLLVDPKYGVLQFAHTDQVREAIKGVAELHRAGKFGKPDYNEELKTLTDAAYAAAYAASAAAHTTDAAAHTTDAASAAYAARAAAYAAASAAYAAPYAASAAYAAPYAASAAYAAAHTTDAAAYAASAAAYAASAASAAAYAASAAAYAAPAAPAAAHAKWREAQAAKLLKLMSQAPILETAACN